MSGYPPESYPPDPYQPQGLPPGAYQPGQSERDPFAPPAAEIRQRVLGPAIGLMVIALFSLLGGLYFVINGAVNATISDEQFKKNVTMFISPEQKAQFDDANFLRNMRTVTLGVCFGIGGASLFLSVLTLFGAIRMMMLKSYGLAVFVSVVAAIPCISPSACCGLGEGIGIWALVILLKPEVRAAFR
jgi:hypothetical protein